MERDEVSFFCEFIFIVFAFVSIFFTICYGIVYSNGYELKISFIERVDE